ncbi:MAG: hypothetical protein H6779_00065 [Candidatus Nomurabacteria bacterium]|nr:MAG: hypothetical protein H6779_00065 [Candidatus Nomurabacteria bacterium]
MIRTLAALLIFIFATPVALGATLYIDPGTATLNRGDAVTLAVRLVPDKDKGECINVVDAELKYSNSIQPVDVSIGQSILSVWLDEPTINRDQNTITFTGGIPNGYCGRVSGDPRMTNIVAEIIFRSPGMQVGVSAASSEAKVEFTPKTQLLLNDGQGTKAELRTLGATFALTNSASSTVSDVWRQNVKSDTIPPEEFSIELVKDNDGIDFNGRYYIVFTTTDKQTGISHYEVMEEPLSKLNSFTWGGADVPWKKPDHANVYVLEDQSLNSTIRVKAVDKAGNEYIATLVPDESLRTITNNQIFNWAILVGVIIILIILGVVAVIILRRRRNSETSVDSADSNDPDLTSSN